MSSPASTDPTRVVPAPFLALDADARRLLQDWTAPDAAQELLRQEFLTHQQAHPGATWRAGPPEHFTASTLILDARLERVLLTLHGKARIWIQVGGHLEASDSSVHAAATREAREESGILNLVVQPALVQLHRHQLGGAFGRCQAHLDLRFAARAEPGAQPVISAESADLRWWPTGELPEPTDPEMADLVLAAQLSLR